MNVQKITCQTHGGTFTREAKRGRPPVSCSPENACDMAATFPRKRKSKRGTETPSQNGAEPPTMVVYHNPSIPLAFDARKALEPHGWQVKGRGGIDPRLDSGTASREAWAEVIATRGEEMITLRWVNGKLVNQAYSLWNTDKPQKNNQPRSRLSFNPEEMTDLELVRELRGQRVHWWNPLGKRVEHAVMPHLPEHKIKVDHLFTEEHGEMDEAPGSRVISFVDQTPNHGQFRAFRIGALLKIG